MAFRRVLSERLTKATAALDHSSAFKPPLPPNVAKYNFHREFITSSDSNEKGIFRRFFHRRLNNQASASILPEFLTLPVGERLKETLRGINLTGDRLRLDILTAPPPEEAGSLDGISVHDARKILRISQLEKVKSTLREIKENSISYTDFLKICAEACSNVDQGLEFAKMMDESGTVIVLGNVVFLRPEQVAKSMTTIIFEAIATPNDPRRKELEKMEELKAVIDQKARSLVRSELYFGLGYVVLQTIGFMRLTFWELSWDVMEPICFFVTSLHFVGAYGFFLRTSKEPSFEGYFQRRFKVKQEKLMKAHNFDVDKYNELCKVFYPSTSFGHEAGGFMRGRRACHA